MAKAGKYHVVRGVVVGVLLAAATFTGLVIRDQVEEKQKATQAVGLVQAVLNAETAQVPDIIGKMVGYRKWTDPLLREENDKAAAKSRQKLHTSLALLPVDPGQVAYLHGRLLDAEPHEVPVIRDTLAPHKGELLDKLWAVVLTPDKGKEAQGLRAAAALAKRAPRVSSGGGRIGEVRPGERKVGKGKLSGGQRSRSGESRVLGTMERGIPAREEVIACAVGRHLPRSQLGTSRRTHPGDQLAGRLRCRQSASIG